MYVCDYFCQSSKGQSICSQENITDTGHISQHLPQQCCITATIKSQQGPVRRIPLAHEFVDQALLHMPVSYLPPGTRSLAWAGQWQMCKRTSPAPAVLSLSLVRVQLLTFHCKSHSQTHSQRVWHVLYPVSGRNRKSRGRVWLQGGVKNWGH